MVCFVLLVLGWSFCLFVLFVCLVLLFLLLVFSLLVFDRWIFCVFLLFCVCSVFGWLVGWFFELHFDLP